MNNSEELSRPAATAASLGANAPDANTFFTKRVLLTGEKDTLSTANGICCFRSALLLLLRMTTDLTVDISNHPGEEEVIEIVREYGVYKIQVTREPPESGRYAAILNIGTKSEENAPIIAINSHGWLFRVTSGGVPISSQCSQANPIGALAAASMGVSEVFKLLVGLKPKRGEPLRGYSYSIWEYSVATNPGLELPRLIELPPTLLIGGGAIGNGIVYLLDHLAVTGDLGILDKQVFKKENIGTCLVLKRSELDKPKAEILSQKLGWAKPLYCDIETYKSRHQKTAPQICLNGLDNVEVIRPQFCTNHCERVYTTA